MNATETRPNLPLISKRTTSGIRAKVGEYTLAQRRAGSVTINGWGAYARIDAVEIKTLAAGAKYIEAKLSNGDTVKFWEGFNYDFYTLAEGEQGGNAPTPPTW